MSEVLHGSGERCCGCVAEGAERTTAELLAQIEQGLDVIRIALALLEPLEHRRDPEGAFTTRGGYKVVGPYLEAIAAKIDGETCCAWMGPDGAGHFVKMVHNGIEYADMQFIAETYDILRNIGGLSPQEIGDVFTRWNNGRLKSYLTEVATEVLAQVDAKTGKAFLDIVKDRAGQKGTGRWTVETALEVGSPVTTIATAVAARALSGQDDIRAAAQQAITGPSVPKVDRQQLIDDLETALWASKVVAYAEGMSLIAKASAEYNWNIDPVRAISVWRAGCIIRANLLTDIRDAFEAAIDVPSLLVAPGIAPRINEAQHSHRRCDGHR